MTPNNKSVHFHKSVKHFCRVISTWFLHSFSNKNVSEYQIFFVIFGQFSRRLNSVCKFHCLKNKTYKLLWERIKWKKRTDLQYFVRKNLLLFTIFARMFYFLIFFFVITLVINSDSPGSQSLVTLLSDRELDTLASWQTDVRLCSLADYEHVVQSKSWKNNKNEEIINKENFLAQKK